jgi:hypothetical protein
MSASSQSCPAAALPFKPLTITEVEIEPSPVLGTSKLYLYAAAGTALGVLFGVAVAATAHIPGLLPKAKNRALVVNPASVLRVPPGPRDFGSMNAVAAGLSGHLTMEWKEKPSYRLVIEPSDPAQQAAFAMAVAGSPRPLSAGFQLKSAAGAVLCSQDVIVRYNPAATAANGDPAGDLEQLKAQETTRERGRDIFENEIGDDGQIAAIDAQGNMPCTQQAYASATGWSFSADFPSVAEQSELLKQASGPAAAQKDAAPRKSNAAGKSEEHGLTASLDGFVVPQAAGR